MTVYAYLRVSTLDQDLEKNRADLLLLADRERLGTVEWVEEKINGKTPWRKRKLGELIEKMENGDSLLVSELSRIGRSMLEVMEVLSILSTREVKVFAVKGDWRLDGSLQSRVMAMVFAMAAEIERDLISARTKEALRAKKAAGIPLGRPPGSFSSRLDPVRPEIEALLANGSTKVFIAKRYGVSKQALHRWLKSRGIK